MRADILRGLVLNTVLDFYKLDDHDQFVDRPHLFTPDMWRHTSIDEFDHLGPRKKVRRALLWHDSIGYIEVAMPSPNSDKFLLRFCAENVKQAFQEMKAAEGRL